MLSTTGPAKPASNAAGFYQGTVKPSTRGQLRTCVSDALPRLQATEPLRVVGSPSPSGYSCGLGPALPHKSVLRRFCASFLQVAPSFRWRPSTPVSKLRLWILSTIFNKRAPCVSLCLLDLTRGKAFACASSRSRGSHSALIENPARAHAWRLLRFLRSSTNARLFCCLRASPYRYGEKKEAPQLQGGSPERAGLHLTQILPNQSQRPCPFATYPSSQRPGSNGASIFVIYLL